ncbi:huntingtin-interacting protein 1 isoform X2 [Bradysia coprophila]|uniref:huntingtin-interacting protein 1 isoform X2 n=1 Tax=Bradysia coprophila TaxID=38358 RepID=UPI00187DB829|nr:huntingtin-interacting protein 1 isoform X2 [Bradysia coprophila]
MSYSDKEYYQLTISISKALNGIEMPLKVKHARAAIIGTFHTQGAHSLWAVSLRQPLQDNRITAWKFCHLLHKVLREGHPLCCQHSMRHRAMLTELGKLWGHLNDGYGISIRHYTKLLVTKLEFHDRNPRIPGNLTLKRGELESIAGNDVNFYFQMAVEMFDYLDDVIALQATIFSSITTFHVNSMTLAGQCRLSPLIPLIQDSNQLYDFLVRIMFKLHGNLPNDVLQGHRDRFRAIFIQLKSFYNQSRNLQYFVNLITVPKLPEAAPNFSSQVDFGSYTAPVVVIPEEPEPEPEPVVDNLVDMGAAREVETVAPVAAEPPTPTVNFEQIIRERDDLIQHLQMEVDRIGKHLRTVSNEQRDNQAILEQQITSLHSQLNDAHEELVNMRFEKEELELKAQSAEKAQIEEEKVKATEDKFQKLKVMYTHIRDEHVTLLRQHGEISKQLVQTTKNANDAIKEKDEIKVEFETLRQQHSKIEEVVQQSTEDAKSEKTELSERLQSVQKENAALTEKFDDLMANSSAEIAELKVNLDKVREESESVKSEKAQIEESVKNLEEKYQSCETARGEVERKLQSALTDLQELQVKVDQSSVHTVSLQQSVQDTEESKAELQRYIDDLQAKHDNLNTKNTELTEKYDVVMEEKLTLANKIDELDKIKEELTNEKEEASIEIETLKRDLIEKIHECDTLQTQVTDTLALKDSEVGELKAKLEETEQKYQEELTEKYNSTLSTIKALESTLEDTKIRDETRMRALMEACIKSSEKLALRAMSENDVASTANTSTYFMLISEELQQVLTELSIVYDTYVSDNSNVEGLARKVILGGHLMATVHVQGMTICNSSADIEFGERTTDEMKKWNQNVLDLFTSLKDTHSDSDAVKSCIEGVRSQLQGITSMIHDLSKKSDSTELVGDIIEQELAGMDKAIEEAANRIEEMLSKSRASDSGIKLEVNEKILDACTALMRCIRILVQKSRLLQAEIVSLGKGTATAKEFYKRNHQWTEGLISAAKSVAQGANFLVTAANKSVSGDGKHQLDLIVAAQEIAACTAQLVVASRVKAPKGSKHLSALGQASRDVTQSTGAVVATAKDCSQRLEDSQDLDLSNLTVHQAKTLEMEIQVKVLELEQGLQVERSRLAAFRRKNYREN